MAWIWILFIISAFVIFFAMVGYPMLLIILDKVRKPPKNRSSESFEPAVTYMIVAHNEEKVIEAKLINALELEYPNEKLEILVASDNSTDRTNDIIEEFIQKHPDRRIRLYTSKEHKGKTNAQNEAQKTVSSEILVMTDANTMVRSDAIHELVSYFTSEDVVYVSGKLVYSNAENKTGKSESTYWNIDLRMRDIESRFQTITAGNGALYACRNREYIDFDPICCHDSSMPYAYALQRKKALFNPNAVAFEKAGENDADEFKRKVRMNRIILKTLAGSVRTINVFKYRWFSLFYFGHRTCRYSLWWAHILLLLTSLGLGLGGSGFGWFCFAAQLLAIGFALIAQVKKPKNRLLRMAGYYGMTVFAQVKGVFRILTGAAKPTWEKAESTR